MYQTFFLIRCVLWFSGESQPSLYLSLVHHPDVSLSPAAAAEGTTSGGESAQAQPPAGLVVSSS